MKVKQYAVIGLGKFGLSVASNLYKLGHDVLGIDIDENIVNDHVDEITHTVIADTTDELALKSLGLHNFDCVVVAISEDIQANLLTTLLLKELNVRFVIAKAANPLHGKMLRKVGADRVIFPESDMGKRVAHNLASSSIFDYIELATDLGLVEILAPSSFVGKNLIQSNLRSNYGVNLVAIKRDSETLVPPSPQDIIQENDLLVIVGKSNSIKKLEELS